MEANEWLLRFLLIVTSLVCTNGDSNGFSDFSLNSDQALDLIPVQMSAQSQSISQSGPQKFSQQAMSKTLPYSPGMGQKDTGSGLQAGSGIFSLGSIGVGDTYTGVVNPFVSGSQRQQSKAAQERPAGFDQTYGAWKSSGQDQTALYSQDKAFRKTGFESSAQISAGAVKGGAMKGLAPGQSGIFPLVFDKTFPGITLEPSKQQAAATQQGFSSQDSSDKLQWEGGFWKRIPPRQPGAVPLPLDTISHQEPIYGYDKPLKGSTQAKLDTTPSMSLPIPGTLPDLLKQPEIPADPVHGLPIDHLYANVPLAPAVDGAVGRGFKSLINALISDIIIVIEASAEFGHIDSSGRVTWNPFVMEFLKKFIKDVPLGPKGNRIGIVIVSVGIDDMISLSSNKKFLLESLSNMRPTFRGGCSGKGIGTANNMFFQYGRPKAVKRVIHLTDSSPFCSYNTMTEGQYARTCGIDIIKLVIGNTLPVQPNVTTVSTQWSIAETVTIKLVWESLMKRAFIAPIHGGWSAWSAWNKCSLLKSCDIGYQQRFRVCDNPKPKYGGVTCKGFYVDTRMCYPRVCIDTTIGHWTRWTEWTVCSVACGEGFQTRTRNCLTLAGQPSPTCRGKYVEIKQCVVTTCPQHGGWSMWGKWGLCSVSCGIGTRTRTRQCDNPPPKFDGKPCKGAAFEESICDQGLRCPIDGGFGPWSEFGQCSAWCGTGEQTRFRECNNPVPQFGGKPCRGMLVDKTVCVTGKPCPIDGGWSTWGGFSACSVTCGMGVKTKERLCNSPVPQYGGAQCEGPAVDEAACTEGVRCAVDGNWSMWSSWLPCKGDCGSGMTKRMRQCNNPMPMYGGQDCIGLAVQTKQCYTGVPCAVDGNWGDWSEWSVCSVKCGTQIVSRHRECDSPPPKYGGAMCFGNSVQEMICDTNVSCPIHGEWSEWSAWSMCSVTCAMGRRQRHRHCDSPAPKYGGMSCEGSPLEDELCDTGSPCPIPGGWSAWVVIEMCDAKCGVGVGKRIRKCNNPSPKYGGADCVGPSLDIFKCDTGLPCPIDGGWGLWSLWSECPVTCGVGLIVRERTCDNPVPQYGGRPCSGPLIQERKCVSGPSCAVDGNWSSWSKWSVCKAICGKGASFRERFCDSPAPSNGGRRCEGPSVDERPCESDIPCPINGGWSAWSTPSACSVSCGTGFMVQTRTCNSPPPLYGGLPCEGKAEMVLVCKTGAKCPIDGNWGPWSDFSKCTVTCGFGTMERRRVCDSPAPAYDGSMCIGDSLEIQQCDMGVFCPVAGGWSPWGDFTACSKTCGIGIQRRSRTCTNPAPQYGGPDCQGLAEEIRKCKAPAKCPTDGNWSIWGRWSICSVICGVGYQQRIRLCNNPPPRHGGGDCFGSPIDEKECDTGMHCPIDGGWSVWSEFSPCSETCGSGIQKRFRKCNAPAPQYGGSKCKGPSEEKTPCDTGTKCPVDGQWTLWSAWAACSVTCGVGMTKKVRECTNPAPMFGGKQCRGPEFKVKKCDTGINCPVPGQWGSWSEYSVCSVTCGYGVSQRHRACDNPSPMYGGEPCVGKMVETKKCYSGASCPIDGGFSLWSQWSICSATCGEGVRTRTRQCNAPTPMFGGADCVGEFIQEEICFAKMHCPVDGGWSVWSRWSNCSAECGEGTQERDRVCNNPVPMYGGRKCQGKNIDIRHCDTLIPCPVNGGWSGWTFWSECSAPCGIGKIKRKRTCTNPEPKYGGQPCEGNNVQEKTCDTKIPCVVVIDGNWSDWSKWGICEAICGRGRQIRFRTCSNPQPQNGGRLCDGNPEEWRECESIPCPINGGWSFWSKWGFCKGDCGMGVQYRTRSCTMPVPKFGGTDCQGNIEESRPCDTGIKCKIDGGWSKWSMWGFCVGECGMGVQYRSRSCTAPAPQFGGAKCHGNTEDSRPCDTGTKCKIDGGWSKWSMWGFCIGECGMGVQYRSRSCTAPAPQFGGAKCHGNTEDSRPCDTGTKCKIDGGWSKWSMWGFCIGECGMGVQYRSRSCTAPAPQFGGAKCQGNTEDSRPCDTGTKCKIDGGWSKWSMWGFCVGECDMGVQYRTRTCTEPAPQFGGALCEGKVEESRSCATGLKCKIDGGWSNWSKWGFCVGECGMGVQYRSRSCTAPAPQFGGALCEGKAEESRSCATGIKCKIDGGWSKWSLWGFCVGKCGMGIQYRSRTCTEPVPQFGGAICEGKLEESRSCATGIKCKIDGGWSKWSVWGFCVGECGMGVQYRKRTCTEPVPMFGGAKCQGKTKESRTCDTGVPCKEVIDGNWSVWSFWSSCSVSCGKGIQGRRRYCDNPPPQNGGTVCKGISEETRMCFADTKCSINGGWSVWGSWSICSASCGEGYQVRVRYCNNPTPMYGGKDCKGFAEERITCRAASDCAVNGRWSRWTKWGACTTTCGKGMQERRRFCDNPSPQNGGTPCVGAFIDRKPCFDNPPCPGQWSKWLGWQRCNCNTGLQTRVRICKTGTDCNGPSTMDRKCSLKDLDVDCPGAEWQKWSHWSVCAGSCGTGVRERTRDCINPLNNAISTDCPGPKTEVEPCKLWPCVKAEWNTWSNWSICSQTCGQGTRQRSRTCIDKVSGSVSQDCKGSHVQTVSCEVLPCPTGKIDCSVECKWDNGIGYNVYPGDCSMFIQCETLNGKPLIQQCSWGLLWNLDILQCTFPHQSKCDKCSKIKSGGKRAYHKTCRSYWTCPKGIPIPNCCAKGYRFDHHQNECVLDPEGACTDACPPDENTFIKTNCSFQPSSLGPSWYEQQIVGVWTPMPCADGTIYSKDDCQCIMDTRVNVTQPPTQCLPELHLNFNDMASDLLRNDGIHIENVKYLGDGTAYFDGRAVCNMNTFSNADWGRDVYMYIRFKPEGKGRHQGLIHNSGCGPSDIGPSVFIGFDRVGSGLQMKFSSVAEGPVVNYEFINITTTNNQMTDAWFTFSNGLFNAKVNGISRNLSTQGNIIARRHGALNIGGNLCQIGTEAFEGFVGIIDEVNELVFETFADAEHLEQYSRLSLSRTPRDSKNISRYPYFDISDLQT